MSEQKIKEMFKQADTELYSARNELYKPAEDVVKYSVCVFARSALYRFMNCLYLIHSEENNDTVKDSQTLEQMIDYCSGYNSQLNEIDFSNVHCKTRTDLAENVDEVYYCNNVNHVKYCAETAERVRELVIEKAWGTFSAEN